MTAVNGKGHLMPCYAFLADLAIQGSGLAVTVRTRTNSLICISRVVIVIGYSRRTQSGGSRVGRTRCLATERDDAPDP